MLVQIAAMAVALSAHTFSDSCSRTTSELRIPTPAGHKLAGELSAPAGARSPVVLMIGGSGKSKLAYDTDCCNESSEVLRSALLCRGVGVFRFDEVGVGKSEGSYEAYATTMTLANDVEAIVNVLATHTRVDPEHIYLLGHSEGGAIAAIVAARSERVNGIILFSAPYLNGREIIKLQTPFRVFVGELTLETAAQENATREKNELWYRFFLDFDPSGYYQRVSQPVLILQGSEDWSVNWRQALQIQDAVTAHNKRANSRCAILEGVAHGLSRRVGVGSELDPRVIAEIDAWLSAVLQSPTFRISSDGCVRLPKK